MAEEQPTQPERTTPPSMAPQRDTIEQAKLIGAVAASVLLAVFFLQNLQRVDINILWFTWHTRMIFALIVSVVLGGVGIFLAMLMGGRRERQRK